MIDVILDSDNEKQFEESIFEWGSQVLSEWIYKLSLNFSNRNEGAKVFFLFFFFCFFLFLVFICHKIFNECLALQILGNGAKSKIIMFFEEFVCLPQKQKN